MWFLIKSYANFFMYQKWKNLLTICPMRNYITLKSNYVPFESKGWFIGWKILN